MPRPPVAVVDSGNIEPWKYFITSRVGWSSGRRGGGRAGAVGPECPGARTGGPFGSLRKAIRITGRTVRASGTGAGLILDASRRRPSK